MNYQYRISNDCETLKYRFNILPLFRPSSPSPSPTPVLFRLCLSVENTGFLGIKTKHSKIKYNKIKEKYYIEVGHVMLEFL